MQQQPESANDQMNVTGVKGTTSCWCLPTSIEGHEGANVCFIAEQTGAELLQVLKYIQAGGAYLNNLCKVGDECEWVSCAQPANAFME